MDDSDPELLDRFVEQRDQAAFAVLVQRHSPLVLGVCQRVLGDLHDAEDAAQAAFLVLARHATRLDHRPPLGPWLYRVAVNLARSALRERRSRERLQQEAAAMPSPKPRADGFTAEIDAALATLPERERSAITLFHLEGRPVEEVARLVGRPVGTVCSWLARGRERLRLQLVRRGVAVSAAFLLGALGGLNAAVVPSTFASATAAAAASFLTATTTVAAATPAAALASQGIQTMGVLHTAKTALIAACLVASVGAAGWIAAAESGGAGKKGGDVLGAPTFMPTAERPIGWRGDGTSQYLGATPPLTWERLVVGPIGHGKQQATKPKGEPGADAADLTPGNALISKWLIVGPFPAGDADPKNMLGQETVPGEANLAGDEGAKIKDQAWRSGWFTDAELKTNGFWTAPNQVAYAHAYLYFQEAGAIDLSVQHEGGMKLWVNGKVVHEDPVTYKYAWGRNKWVPATVEKGWNRLLFKVTRTDKESWGGVFAMPPNKGASYATKNIRWSMAMPGYSNSTPLVVGDRIFTTAEPNDLICLDKKTGKILWVRNVLAYYAAMDDKFTGINLDEKRSDVMKLEAMNEQLTKAEPGEAKSRDSFQERAKLATGLQDWVGKTKEYNYHCPGWGGGNSAPTPCTDGQYIYAWYGEAGLLGCYGLDGTRRWIRYIHPLGPGEGSHHGVNGSPVISGDRIVIPGWGCFLGVDHATGKEFWRSKYNGVAYSTHVVTRIGGADAIILPTGRIMRPGDGTIMTPDFKGRYDGECQSTAIDREHGLFAVMSWGEMSICRIPQDAAAKEVQVIGKIAAPGKDGTIDDNYNVSSPLFDNGLLYWSSTRGLFQVADVATGMLIYKKRLPLYPATAYGPQGAGVGASLCKAGGNIYILDNRGTSVVVAPGREFKLLAINHLQDLNNQGDQQEVVQATPVFDGNAIYIRGHRNLYCISEK